MSRLDRRRDRVKEVVSVFHLLISYGYRVQENDYEQQFQCDLHGTGRDDKPSARVYTDNSWYCFACAEQRDVIATVEAKEDLSYPEAIRFLEERYNLEPLPWEDDDAYQKPESLQDNLRAIFDDKGVTYEGWCKQVHTFIDSFTQDRTLSLENAERFWEMYDKITWMVSKNLLTETSGSEAMSKILTKTKEHLKALNCDG